MTPNARSAAKRPMKAINTVRPVARILPKRRRSANGVRLPEGSSKFPWRPRLLRLRTRPAGPGVGGQGEAAGAGRGRQPPRCPGACPAVLVVSSLFAPRTHLGYYFVANI